MSERVLVVGECLLDEIVGVDGSRTRRLGGSPANVAMGLAALGRPVDLWTSLGEDAAGRELADQLQTAGVRLVGEVFSAERTSVATGVLDAAGVATWTIDWVWQPEGSPVQQAADDVVAVHVGSLAAVFGDGAERVRRELAAVPTTWLRCYDVNARVGVSGRGPQVLHRVEEWLNWAHVARASVEDLNALWPDRSVEAVLLDWLGTGARPGTVVLTDGAAGLQRISRFSREVVPGPGSAVGVSAGSGVGAAAGPSRAWPSGAASQAGSVAEPWPVVDTVGAGDAVTAAMVDELLNRRGEMENWGPVVRRAQFAGALSVTRAGFCAPTAAELDSPRP